MFYLDGGAGGLEPGAGGCFRPFGCGGGFIVSQLEAPRPSISKTTIMLKSLFFIIPIQNQ